MILTLLASVSPILLAQAPAGAPQDPPIVLLRDAEPAPWSAEAEDRQVVDFRFAPGSWDTAICHPDDAQKTLVSEEGELLIDYAGRPGQFRIRIGVDAGEREVSSQKLVDPRVPMVETNWWGPRSSAITTFAFALPPEAELPEWDRPPETFFRVAGGQRPEPGWGRPEEPAHPAFSDVVVGWGEAIAYRFPAPEEAATLALGFIESHHQTPGARLLEVFVEGERRRTLDPLAEFGARTPGVVPLEVADADGDGEVLLEVRCAPGSPDPNATLAALWLFEEPLEDPAALAEGRFAPGASAALDCGAGRAYDGPPRADALWVGGLGEEPLRVAVETDHRLEPGDDRLHALLDGRSFLAFTERFEDAERDGDRWVFSFDPEVREVWAVAASGFEIGEVNPRWLALQARAAQGFWEDLDLPYEAIQVPDPGIQDLLDSSIRNIWQAREMKDGLPAFQVGPTCYRGLWVVDGAFLLEAVTLLGRGEEARAGIDHLLSHQKEDGSFELLSGYWKENGIVLYVLYRHALLTGDLGWLEERWPVVERVVGAIQGLRERSREDPEAPGAGLLPPGFPDGGVGGIVPEYTNVYWCLAGLRAASRAASLLGRTEQARAWEAELADLMAAFREASAATRIDRGEGAFALPILMEPKPEVAPVRGQWAFCHALYPGQVFEPSDPLVRGNLGLLDEHGSEGLVLGTGWLADGIWNYFASFYAHAHLWAGNGEKAADVLYAFANHASPLLAWREEQMPQGQGERIVGDMPHNWASAELIRLVRDLIVLERGDELHLLEGLPRAWLKPGAITCLEGVATDFGPLNLVLHVHERNHEASLLFAPPRERPPERIAVHLGAWAREAAAPRELEGGWYEVMISLDH